MNKNKNPFNFFDTAQPIISRRDKRCLYFSTHQLTPYNTRFMPGPANAIRMLCNGVAVAGKETYAGARISRGELNALSTTPNRSPHQKIKNVALNPNAIATNL